MKLLVCLVFAGFFFVSNQSEAATVYGISSKECKSIGFDSNNVDLVDLLDAQSSIYAQAWFTGYLSAVNMVCRQNTTLSLAQYWKTVQSVCQSNPEMQLVQAASRAIMTNNPAIRSCGVLLNSAK